MLNSAKPISGTPSLQSVMIAGREGLFDITIDNGMIASIKPAAGGSSCGAQCTGIVTPLMADAHVHLDKTYTISRIEEHGDSQVNSLFDAIALMENDRKNWSADDIYQRASNALEMAYAQGVGAMRTHVDWVYPEVPTAWPVLVRLREEWKNRIDLQLAALIHGDIVLDNGASIASQVAQDSGVLGAFFYRNADLQKKIDMMFALAKHHDLDLDFHVDEGMEVEADGLSLIIEAAKKYQWSNRVLCGHACSLNLRSDQELDLILSNAKAAGAALVALPTSNLYLQDRLGGKSPKLRGIAPIKEAQSAGLDVLLASDNVGDAFYPYGDYDPLAILRLAATVSHISPEQWLGSITLVAARICGSTKVVPIEAGQPANLTWHDASTLNEMISRPQTRRIVMRAGKPIEQF